MFLVVPLGALIQASLKQGALHIAPDTAAIMGLAVVQAACSTVLALCVGLPVAAVVSRYEFRGRAMVQALVTIPFVLPTVVVALALRSLFGGGVVQGFAIVVVAHAYVNLAVVVRLVGAVWAQQDPRFSVVARTLGARRTRVWWSVEFPLLRGSIISSAAVVFVFSFTSLGIALLLGDSSTRTLEMQILRQTSVLLDFSGAAATAIVQIFVVTLALVVSVVATRRTAGQRLRPVRRTPVPHGPQGLVVRAIGVLVGVIVVAPIAALVAASLRVNGAWSWQWWQSAGSVDAGTTRLGSPLAAVIASLTIALVAGLIASVVGTLAGIAVLAGGRGRIIALLAVVPLGVSAATLGLGTLLAFGRPPVDLRATGMLVPLAHSLVAIPLVVAVVAPALRSQDRRGFAVASSLGARPTRAFLTAYGPVLRVVVLAAGGLAFAVSLGEFGAASFLGRTGNPTVPIQIFRLLGRPGEQSYGVAAVLSVILVAMTLTMVLVVDRLGWSRRKA